MPKVSVYLPDELYEAARSHGLSLSRLTQQAIRAAIDEAPNAAWLEQVRSRPPRCETEIDTSELLDEVREEFGT
jgi:post-segregation antitoxin (ccd killing protein)